jgi:hypothetical protein
MYVGILPLILAVVACIPRRGRHKQPEIAFWVVLALVCLLLSLGGKAFLYRLFYWAVPGFNLFRSQERAIYLTSFCLAILAGYGWSALSSVRDGAAGTRVIRQGMLGLGILSLLTAAVVWAIESGQGGLERREWLKASLLWAGWTWIAWGLVRWMPRQVGGWRRGIWAVLSVVLVAVDLVTANRAANLAPGPAESRVYDGAWLAPVTEQEGLFRIANEWGLPGNGGCWLRLQDLYGASPLRLQEHKAMADALPHWRLWQLFGVRYVATWEHDLPGPFSATRIAMHGEEWAKNTVYVHRLEADFPRAWVVHRARQADDGQALALLAEPGFDPSVEILVSRPLPAGFTFDIPDHAAVVDVVSYAPEEIVVQVDLFASGWLLLGEWDYPGWQASVDGERQAMYRVDYGLRAVPLETGRHRIVFRYRPTSFYAGAAISAVTLFALAGAMLRRRH